MAIFTIRWLLCGNLVTYPFRCVHSHYFLEGNVECIVTTETTLESQLLNHYWLMVSDCLVVEVDEVLDAQTVDVAIVSHTQTGEMLAQIETVGANQVGKLGNGNVVLQIKWLCCSI